MNYFLVIYINHNKMKMAFYNIAKLVVVAIVLSLAVITCCAKYTYNTLSHFPRGV